MKRHNSDGIRDRIVGEVEQYVRSECAAGNTDAAVAAGATKRFNMKPSLASSSVTRWRARQHGGTPAMSMHECLAPAARPTTVAELEALSADDAKYVSDPAGWLSELFTSKIGEMTLEGFLEDLANALPRVKARDRQKLPHAMRKLLDRIAKAWPSAPSSPRRSP